MSTIQLSSVLAVMLCLGASSLSHAQDPADPAVETIAPDSAERSFDSIRIAANKVNIDLTVRFSKVLEFREKLLEVDGHDPDVISVKAVTPNRLRIQGIAQGVTTMVVKDANNQRFVIEVYVSGDARLLQSVLTHNFPGSAIECRILKNESVLLTGWVTDNQTISQITEVAQAYHPFVINHMRVGGPQEVLLRVKIIEVQRSKLRVFGLNFQSLSHAVLTSTPGSIAPLKGLVTPIGGAADATLGLSAANPSTLAIGLTSKHAAFQGYLQALKEEGLLKIRAEPVLVTRSGEAARLENGGEFPIPVPGGLGTITIEWREFGVILQTLPIVIGPTRVKQHVTAEVSEKDVANSVSLGGTIIPGLTKRKIQTCVDMNFGDTMVLGGLITTRTTSTTFKTPFLGELPLIGAAFRKVTEDYAETELLIMITPEFVTSLPTDQVPPGGPGMTTTNPTDRELYSGGLIEVPVNGSNEADCDDGFSVKFNPGNYSTGAGAPMSTPIPTTSPTPSYSPGPPGLIGPPGATPSGSVPPSPSANPSVSARKKNGSSWPANLRGTESQAANAARRTEEFEEIKRVKYQKPAKSDRSTKTKSLDSKFEAP